MITARAALVLLPGTTRCKRWKQKRCIPSMDFFGGKQQVAYLKWKCTGIPTAMKNMTTWQSAKCVTCMVSGTHSAIALLSSLCKVQRIKSGQSWRWKAALLTTLRSTVARTRTPLQALLPDAGRGTWRRGTRWTKMTWQWGWRRRRRQVRQGIWRQQQWRREAQERFLESE